MRSPDTATVAAMVADYRRGLPLDVIAARHGWSANSVLKYARLAGVGPRTERGVCSSCTKSRRVNPDGLCGLCEQDVPLTGGQWVYDRRRGVEVWVDESEVDDVA